jgi:hypothetical protein
MKNLILCLILTNCLLASAQAQRNSSQSDRNWAVGLRLGDPAGINVRKYLGGNNALELNLGNTGLFYGGKSRSYSYGGYGGYRGSGLAVQVNYIWQNPISSVDGLEWYWGLGGQFSSRRFYYLDNDYYKKYSFRTAGYYESRAALGATGVVGLEWTIPDTQVSLFTDLGLYLEIVPAPFWLNVPVGIGARYNF